MKFFDYMLDEFLDDEGCAGVVARKAHHSITAPVDSNELSDWAAWLRQVSATDEMANGLTKAWWMWRDKQEFGGVDRCPMCGVSACYHVCDMFKQGRRVAQALICEEHGMYFVGDKSYEQSDVFEKVATDAINSGLVTKLPQPGTVK